MGKDMLSVKLLEHLHAHLQHVTIREEGGAAGLAAALPKYLVGKKQRLTHVETREEGTNPVVLDEKLLQSMHEHLNKVVTQEEGGVESLGILDPQFLVAIHHHLNHVESIQGEHGVEFLLSDKFLESVHQTQKRVT